MAKKLDKASQTALSKLKAYHGGRGAEPDWEGGTLGTFRHFVVQRAKALHVSLPDTVLERIAEEVHDERGAEQGMAAQINDLGYQPWLADSLAIAMRHTLESKVLASTKSDRELLLIQIDTLCLALQENLDAVEQRKNHPPTLDLALDNNPVFLREVRRLSKLLRETRAAVSRRNATSTSTLVAKALDQFVTSLASSVGSGVGRTVTWTTFMILSIMTISILKELGVPVTHILSSIKDLLPK